MRACFLGENVCALGFGVAIIQTQALHGPEETETQVTESPLTPPADMPLENLMAREWRRRSEIMDQVLSAPRAEGAWLGPPPARP
jgi:hypothetical protein